MSGERYWKPGHAVAVRDVYRGQIRAAVAMRVVEDTALRTVLYLQPGAQFFLPADENARLTKDLARFTQLLELRWQGFEQLSIAMAGDAHAAIARWAGPGREFAEWYVNLQSPLERTPIGFDATDHALDLVVSPDLKAIRWKDEAQLADLVAADYFSAEQAAAIRLEAERVIRRIQRRAPPFCDGWEQWLPDPGWVAPDLPARWRQI